MIKRVFAAAVAALVFAGAAAAHAAIVTADFSGTVTNPYDPSQSEFVSGSFSYDTAAAVEATTSNYFAQYPLLSASYVLNGVASVGSPNATNSGLAVNAEDVANPTGPQVATLSFNNVYLSLFDIPNAMINGYPAPPATAQHGSATLTIDGLLQSSSPNVTVAVSAAPEPAAWAMMLAGLAAIGGAMRISRRRGAALARI